MAGQCSANDISMIKISDLKRVKKLCFDRIARDSANSKLLVVDFKPICIDAIEVLLSNGNNYGRIILDNESKTVFSSFSLGWTDFVKICELFKSQIVIKATDKEAKIKEGKTVLNCRVYNSTYNSACKFKFDFSTAKEFDATKVLMLDDHLEIQKYAIVSDELISCDGHIGIVNKIKTDFEGEPLVYTDYFPAEKWFINRNHNLIVSGDKRIAMTHPQACGSYPVAVLTLAKQQLSNSFTCSGKELVEKMQQCSLIYSVMEILFGEKELIIRSLEVGDSKYETVIPVEYEHKTSRAGFRFSIKYFAYFCKCADKNGRVTIMFDDNQNVQMFRSESELYTIFGMGIGSPRR